MFELNVVLLNLHLQSHEMCFTNVFASNLFVVILKALICVPFVLLRTHIFVDKSLPDLQLPLYLSRLTMSG